MEYGMEYGTEYGMNMEWHTAVFRSVDPIHLGRTGIRMLNIHNLPTLDSLTQVPSG